jgi:hypothetical protein
MAERAGGNWMSVGEFHTRSIGNPVVKVTKFCAWHPGVPARWCAVSLTGELMCGHEDES